jgi:hypothetical protein
MREAHKAYVGGVAALVAAFLAAAVSPEVDGALGVLVAAGGAVVLPLIGVASIFIGMNLDR